jgi:glutamine cyclotransferase
MGLDASHFGEGITILGDELYQLTWKNQKCLVYNKSDFKSIKEFTYTGEGWGLCNDGKSLIMSDGSERIYFRNPKTFDVERTIEVYTDQGPIARLNELEYVDGLIYANIWTSNNVAVIDPATTDAVRGVVGVPFPEKSIVPESVVTTDESKSSILKADSVFESGSE